jgi:predicted ATPase
LAAREPQLEALMSAWVSRDCCGVVVVGPAGVGKTRLAEEFLARTARKDRLRTARAATSAAAAQVPLGALAHLIPAEADMSEATRGFTHVAQVLGGPRHKRKWAVLVDDLHLLDAASTVLLRQLMAAGIVRLIATVRSGEPLGEAPSALLAGDSVHRIDLEAFTPKEVETVLEAALGGVISRRTAHEMATASGGNALYLRELASIRQR